MTQGFIARPTGLGTGGARTGVGSLIWQRRASSLATAWASSQTMIWENGFTSQPRDMLLNFAVFVATL